MQGAITHQSCFFGDQTVAQKLLAYIHTLHNKLRTGFTGVESIASHARVFASVKVNGARDCHRVVDGILKHTLRQLIVDCLVVLFPCDLQILHLIRVCGTCARKLGFHALWYHHIHRSCNNLSLSCARKKALSATTVR